MGQHRLTTSNRDEAARLVAELRDADVWAKLHTIYSWPCQQCGKTVENRGGRDQTCECGAEYNAFGQRLRDDWRSNPSNWDDNIGDMEGFEIQQLSKEHPFND
ncbi:hypothetical protein AWB91_09025 [Mycobacterium paraense]|uniref:Uncharacterized protein n=1 Tax=Mycobacterium paraense TaxID=767916 RepID=A0ABX3VSK7_9MYCO|nr:hypothetical protein AWB91_09025 [Mycobacterium paraense]ORW34706.1 hypothetical protein AWB88_02755 [Mycobacterium paraense]